MGLLNRIMGTDDLEDVVAASDMKSRLKTEKETANEIRERIGHKFVLLHEVSPCWPGLGEGPKERVVPAWMVKQVRVAGPTNHPDRKFVTEVFLFGDDHFWTEETPAEVLALIETAKVLDQNLVSNPE
jgi:hypothetical protein